MMDGESSQIINGAALGFDTISREETQRRLGDGSLVVVDVLPREAYQNGHIPGAISLPLAEVSSRAPDVIPDRQADIAVYCASFT
jgi:rhodanese-related sulfurtransferase